MDRCIPASLGEYANSQTHEVDQTCVRVFNTSPESIGLQLRLRDPQGVTPRRVRSMFAHLPVSHGEAVQCAIALLQAAGIDLTAVLTEAVGALECRDPAGGQRLLEVAQMLRAVIASTGTG